MFASVSCPCISLTFNNHMTTPVMTDCVKSLFGMNVNLLADNPDWKWYLVVGAASLLLTLAMWMIFKLNSVSQPTTSNFAMAVDSMKILDRIFNESWEVPEWRLGQKAQNQCFPTKETEEKR